MAWDTGEVSELGTRNEHTDLGSLVVGWGEESLQRAEVCSESRQQIIREVKGDTMERKILCQSHRSPERKWSSILPQSITLCE